MKIFINAFTEKIYMRKKCLGIFALLVAVSLAAVIQFPQSIEGNVSLCDRFLMTEQNKDVLILDICSDTKTTVNILSVSDPALKEHRITGVMYYPYNETNRNAVKPEGIVVSEWTRTNETSIIITQPLEIYPSKHSNILVIVLDKKYNEDSSPIVPVFIAVGIIILCSTSAVMVIRKWKR